MSNLQPVELKRSGNRELEIFWSDGVRQQIPFRVLRDACQCARCMDAKTERPKTEQAEKSRGSLRVLSAAETMPLEIQAMQPVGNYAYNIRFSDGHSTGIYTFDLLRSLS